MLTRTVADGRTDRVIGGFDPHDSTSLNEPVPALSAGVESVARAGKIRDFAWASSMSFPARIPGRRERSGCATVEKLRDAGAEIVEVSCPSFEYALAAYYLIMPAEVSSNLARFDGMRYGIRVEPSEGPVC